MGRHLRALERMSSYLRGQNRVHISPICLPPGGEKGFRVNGRAHKDDTATDKTSWIDRTDARKYIRITFGQLITNLATLAAPLLFATHRRTYRRALSRGLLSCAARSPINYLWSRGKKVCDLFWFVRRTEWSTGSNSCSGSFHSVRDAGFVAMKRVQRK